MTSRRSWKTESYGEDTVYKKDDGMKVFDDKMQNTYHNFAKDGLVDKAKEMWPMIWDKALDGREKYRDGTWLYVGIAKKP